MSWGFVLGLLLLAGLWKVPRALPGAPGSLPTARPDAVPGTPSKSASGRRRESPAPSRSGDAASRGDVFSSRAACRQLVERGERAPRASQSARFASWNLRWFPDGTPGSSEPGTDVAWVACVLGWLDADVVALQEVKGTPKAERALEQLLAELNQLTGRRYVVRLDDCGRRVPQHVGLLFDEARVTLSELQTVAELNPSGSPCDNQWRPGLGGRFVFPGGLDLLVVSAHFKSQDDARSLSLRRASFAAAPGVKQRAAQASRDDDWLLLGDLNTMGCSECEPPITPSEELSAVRQLLAKGGLRLVDADASGTELHAGRYSWLDHALASSSMRELAASAKVHVAGPCGQAPGRAARMPLSDHCPVLLDLSDRDLD